MLIKLKYDAIDINAECIPAWKAEGLMKNEFNIINGSINGDYKEIGKALESDPMCINEQDELGLTAAHHSIFLKNYGVLIRLAQDSNFDPFVEDNFGRRPIDCCNTQPEMQKFRRILLYKMYGTFPEVKNELTIK